MDPGVVCLWGLQGKDKHRWGLLPTHFIKTHGEAALAPHGMWMAGLCPTQAPGATVGPSPPPQPMCGPCPSPCARSGGTLLWKVHDVKIKRRHEPLCLQPLSAVSAQLPPAAGRSEAWPGVLATPPPALPSPTPRLTQGPPRTSHLGVGGVLWQRSTEAGRSCVGVGLHHLAVHGHREGQAQDLWGHEGAGRCTSGTCLQVLRPHPQLPGWPGPLQEEGPSQPHP